MAIGTVSFELLCPWAPLKKEILLQLGRKVTTTFTFQGPFTKKVMDSCDSRRRRLGSTLRFYTGLQRKRKCAGFTSNSEVRTRSPDSIRIAEFEGEGAVPSSLSPRLHCSQESSGTSVLEMFPTSPNAFSVLTTWV